MGTFQEHRFPARIGWFFLLAAFLLLFPPWHLADQELSRVEGFYAAQTEEFSSPYTLVTAHGVAIRNAYMLYPALVKLLSLITGTEHLEFALRLFSILMVLAGTVIVWFAAGGMKRGGAGLVACAMFLSTNVMVEKGVDGYPTTLTMTLLLLSQLLWFYFGVRKNNWNAAWIITAAPLSLAFLSGGFLALLYFAFPLVFLRRPLSVKSKFEKPGFAIGLTILVLTALIRVWPYFQLSRAVPPQYLWWEEMTLGDYFLSLLNFPLDLFFRLLPWSLLAWLPFCVALQPLDQTPIYSRYLRTLFFATLALVWILPDESPRSMLFFLGPLSILTGINYELGMRRYGFKMRRLMQIFPWTLPILAGAIVLFLFVPKEWLDPFMSLQKSIDFRSSLYFIVMGSLCAIVIALTAFLLMRRRGSCPIWLTLLTFSACCGLFFWLTVHAYRGQSAEKRELGTRLKAALSANGIHGITIYKLNIFDLYSELHYTGEQVRSISDLTELPAEQKTVYVLTTEFPQFPDRTWTNLLPPNFTYRSHRLCLWRGDLRKEENDTEHSSLQ